MVAQMYQEQVSSVTITIDDDGSVLSGHDLLGARMVPRWSRFLVDIHEPIPTLESQRLMNSCTDRCMVAQMHQDQGKSATITIDDGGGLLRAHDSAVPRMVSRWRRFWWILMSRYQLESCNGL